MNPTISSRQGFTLIEVLMVIAIIGVLVGLAVPAVGIAFRSFKQRAIGFECQSLANSIAQYKTKYGEYPPDGADSALLVRHLRKAFPQIAATELALLGGTLSTYPSGFPAPANSTRGLSSAVMDPSEALVFFLGGFSDDPAFPFSGPGGPFYLEDSGTQVKSNAASISRVQYNTDRVNSLFPFNQSQLSLEVNSAGITTSSDDADLLPEYHPGGLTQPFVYFEARTYQQSTVANVFSTTSNGIVYPYRSTEVNTKVDKNNTAIASRNSYFKFVNDKSFQLISAGLDDHYGGTSGLFYMYAPIGASSGTSARSGESLDLVAAIPAAQSHPNATYTRFTGAGENLNQADNVANFAEGLLEDSLEN